MAAAAGFGTGQAPGVPPLHRGPLGALGQGQGKGRGLGRGQGQEGGQGLG